MQGVYARRVQHPGHLGPHGHHVQRGIFAAGRVIFVKHRVGPGLVALGGVGVHDENLRLTAVFLDGKWQALGRHGSAQVGVGVLGAVFDAARRQLHIAVAAALFEGHAADAPGRF